MYICDVVLRMENFQMKNPEVFEGKSFQDILKEIYTQAVKKRKSIETLMDTIADMIEKPNDAAILVPVVRDLIDIGIKNDEHLVKIATIVQRLMTAGESSGQESGEWVLSQEDRDALMKEAKEFKDGKDIASDALSAMKVESE